MASPIPIYSRYIKLIIEITGCPRLDAPLVEQAMRVKHRNLDGLSPREFRVCAKNGWRTVQLMYAIVAPYQGNRKPTRH